MRRASRRSRSTPSTSGWIGKGGETIRSLESDYDVQIDIEEDGTISSRYGWGQGRRGDRRDQRAHEGPEPGDQYTGNVVKTTDFGAFVELKKGPTACCTCRTSARVGRHIEDVIRAATCST